MSAVPIRVEVTDNFAGQAKCTVNSAQICGGNVDGTFYDSVYLV